METTSELGKIDLKQVTEEQLEAEKLADEEELKVAEEGYYRFSLAELGASITSSLDQSVAASEFRALEFQEFEHWELSDLVDILRPRDLVTSEVTWKKIEREIFTGNSVNRIYLALKQDHAFYFTYDDNIEKIQGFSSDPSIEVPEDGFESFFKDTENDWVFVSCHKKAETKLAFIPSCP